MGRVGMCQQWQGEKPGQEGSSCSGSLPATDSKGPSGVNTGEGIAAWGEET